MKVAFIHYWLVGMRGGEKVLEALCELFPEADIYTLVADKSKLSPTILKHKITTSWLQKIGGVKNYKKMLPLMPNALESFDLTGYDLIISSEAGPAKGVIIAPDATHICYCHSPMRYIWDLYPQYYNSAGKISRFGMGLFSSWLRTWDVTTANRVDYFIANSNYVAKRINKFYRREAKVINPPLFSDGFEISKDIGDYYLCFGQITPYKKIEIAIEACNKLGKKLIVAGNGASKELKQLAGDNVIFKEEVSDLELKDLLSNAKALLYPGLEDFGIIPLESMASGRPVIAYGRGGVIDTIIDGKTGILFQEQTAESMAQAIQKFEENIDSFKPEIIREYALNFNITNFKNNLKTFIDECIKKEKQA